MSSRPSASWGWGGGGGEWDPDGFDGAEYSSGPRCPICNAFVDVPPDVNHGDIVWCSRDSCRAHSMQSNRMWLWCGICGGVTNEADFTPHEAFCNNQAALADTGRPGGTSPASPRGARNFGAVPAHSHHAMAPTILHGGGARAPRAPPAALHPPSFTIHDAGLGDTPSRRGKKPSEAHTWQRGRGTSTPNSPGVSSVDAVMAPKPPPATDRRSAPRSPPAPFEVPRPDNHNKRKERHVGIRTNGVEGRGRNAGPRGRGMNAREKAPNVGTGGNRAWARQVAPKRTRESMHKAEGADVPRERRGKSVSFAEQPELGQDESANRRPGKPAPAVPQGRKSKQPRSKESEKAPAKKAKLSKGRRTLPPLPPSPPSPATQTLDRLSWLGSKEGGAELMLHKLPNSEAPVVPSSTKGKKGDKDDANGSGGATSSPSKNTRSSVRNKPKANEVEGLAQNKSAPTAGPGVAISTEEKRNESGRLLCMALDCGKLRQVRSGGFCLRHFSKNGQRPAPVAVARCLAVECDRLSQAGCGGFCTRHSSVAISTEEKRDGRGQLVCMALECEKVRQGRCGGFCLKHFNENGGQRRATVARCLAVECDRHSQTGCGGFCTRHFNENGGLSAQNASSPTAGPSVAISTEEKRDGRGRLLCMALDCGKLRQGQCGGFCTRHFNANGQRPAPGATSSPSKNTRSSVRNKPKANEVEGLAQNKSAPTAGPSVAISTEEKRDERGHLLCMALDCGKLRHGRSGGFCTRHFNENGQRPAPGYADACRLAEDTLCKAPGCGQYHVGGLDGFCARHFEEACHILIYGQSAVSQKGLPGEFANTLRWPLPSQTKKSTNLPPKAVAYLKAWMTVHVDNPYPTQKEKVEIMAKTGIGLTQLKNWFEKSRQLYWNKPSNEAKLDSSDASHSTKEKDGADQPPVRAGAHAMSNRPQSDDYDQRLFNRLPQFMRKFIAASRKQSGSAQENGRTHKWIRAPNPWGKLGHQEGDDVIITPFQSESEGDLLRVYHQGPDGGIPKRFVSNPLETDSPYLCSHSPTATVLELKRDPCLSRPWGFIAEMDEFAGACLVTSVEPQSPADAAVDFLSREMVGLRPLDMIVMIGARSIGDMTKPELMIEMDVAGPTLRIVVSRCLAHEQFPCNDVPLQHALAVSFADQQQNATSANQPAPAFQQVSPDFGNSSNGFDWPAPEESVLNAPRLPGSALQIVKALEGDLAKLGEFKELLHRSNLHVETVVARISFEAINKTVSFSLMDIRPLLNDPYPWTDDEMHRHSIVHPKWLNDNTITAFVHALNDEFETEGRRVLVLTTQFYRSLVDNDAKSVLRWLKGKNISDYDQLVVPIHADGAHFYLADANILEASLTLYDSGISCNDEKGRIQLCTNAREIADNLNAFVTVALEAEATKTGSMPLLVETPMEAIVGRCAIQNNGYDCGVRVLLNMCSVVNGEKPLTVLNDGDNERARDHFLLFFANKQVENVVEYVVEGLDEDDVMSSPVKRADSSLGKPSSAVARPLIKTEPGKGTCAPGIDGTVKALPTQISHIVIPPMIVMVDYTPPSTTKNEDILVGRGTAYIWHPGNMRLGEIVNRYRAVYEIAGRNDKPKVRKLIVGALRSANPPSRFLRKNKDSGLWEDAGDTEAATKVGTRFQYEKTKAADSSKDESDDDSSEDDDIPIAEIVRSARQEEGEDHKKARQRLLMEAVHEKRFEVGHQFTKAEIEAVSAQEVVRFLSDKAEKDSLTYGKVVNRLTYLRPLFKDCKYDPTSSRCPEVARWLKTLTGAPDSLGKGGRRGGPKGGWMVREQQEESEEDSSEDDDIPIAEIVSEETKESPAPAQSRVLATTDDISVGDHIMIALGGDVSTHVMVTGKASERLRVVFSDGNDDAVSFSIVKRFVDYSLDGIEEGDDQCFMCGNGDEEKSALILCEHPGCCKAFHCKCLCITASPSELPEDWKCPLCAKEVLHDGTNAVSGDSVRDAIAKLPYPNQKTELPSAMLRQRLNLHAHLWPAKKDAGVTNAKVAPMYGGVIKSAKDFTLERTHPYEMDVDNWNQMCTLKPHFDKMLSPENGGQLLTVPLDLLKGDVLLPSAIDHSAMSLFFINNFGKASADIKCTITGLVEQMFRIEDGELNYLSNDEQVFCIGLGKLVGGKTLEPASILLATLPPSKNPRKGEVFLVDLHSQGAFTEKERPPIIVDWLTTTAAMRGKGIATYLLQCVCSLYRYADFGPPRILLAARTTSDTMRLQKWYEEKLGFQRLEWRDLTQHLQKYAISRGYMFEETYVRGAAARVKQRESLEKLEKVKPFIVRKFVRRAFD